MRKAISTDKAMKRSALPETTSLRTGCSIGKAWTRSSARKEHSGENDISQHAIEGAEEKHGQREAGLQQYRIGRCAEAGMKLAEGGEESARLSHGIADAWSSHGERRDASTDAQQHAGREHAGAGCAKQNTAELRDKCSIRSYFSIGKRKETQS